MPGLEVLDRIAQALGYKRMSDLLQIDPSETL
jgi:hypothetical protein